MAAKKIFTTAKTAVGCHTLTMIKNCESEKIPFISLFTGCGGIDLGLEATGGFSSKLCVELETAYFDTLKGNQGQLIKGDNIFLEDARLINGDVFSEESLSAIGDLSKNFKGIWAIVAGPPCQSFSTLGNRAGDADPRGNLTLEYFKLIAKLRPPIFLFENVPPLGQKAGIAIRREIFELLQEAGYTFTAKIVNMADYGCYTKRKRFIIVGSLLRDFGFPEETHSEEETLFKPKWRRSFDALKGLPDPYKKNRVTHHDPVYHTEDVKARFEGLQHGQYDRKRHRSKLDPEKPGPTLVAGATGGYCHHIHWNSRELTSRESARLHGFHDKYQFSGTKLDVAKQIANSIPVNFGEAIGQWLISELRRLGN